VNYTSEHSISSTSPFCERSEPRSGRTLTERAVGVSEQVSGFSKAQSLAIGERSETLSADYMGRGFSGGVEDQRHAERLAPPDSNTGVLTALVDWMSFTLPENVHCIEFMRALERQPLREPLEVVKSLFGSEGWVILEKGDLGYKQGLCKGRIRIYFDGNPGMGIHVRLSGQGCRELEGASEFQGWQNFLTQVLDLGAKFTRFDVAMDDDRHLLQGGQARITMQAVQSCVDNGQVVSTYRKARGMWEKTLGDGAPDEIGNTIYFGSRQSDSLIRFYDKGLQQQTESYVRVELELHDKQAQAMAVMIGSGSELGELLAGVLRRKLDFKEASGHSQRERRRTLSWWSEFLAGVEKMRLGIAPIVRTLQKGMTWALRQVAPMLALIQDYADAAGFDFIADMRSEGLRRRTPYHTEMLSSALLSLSS
jgi:phage replication initiation protein